MILCGRLNGRTHPLQIEAIIRKKKKTKKKTVSSKNKIGFLTGDIYELAIQCAFSNILSCEMPVQCSVTFRR